ncbi:hypothetical protein S83_018144 [Arachis hypogaea]
MICSKISTGIKEVHSRLSSLHPLSFSMAAVHQFSIPNSKDANLLHLTILSRHSLLGNPRSVLPLAVLRLIVVQVVFSCSATFHSSTHQLPPPSSSNHSPHGSLVASPR